MNGDHAFVDESIRNGAYLMCVTVVRPRHLDEARKALRLMRVRGQHKIHFAEESDKRRRQLLGDIALLPAKSAIYVARTGDQVGARRLILGAMRSNEPVPKATDAGSAGDLAVDGRRPSGSPRR